jgi:hypothetical protein
MANNNSQQEPALPVGEESKRKSVDLLPKYFRTQANQKILSSTLDQLVQPGVAEKMSGYFGRQTAKSFRANDTYIEDVSEQRQNRQLEPATVVTDDLGNVNFYGDYTDLVNQIENLNGTSSNQSLLNSQEYYSWNPSIDWDKFVNFRDYYWMPTGPQTVTVYGKSLEEQSEFTVTTEDMDDNTVYKFDPPGFTSNPTLTLYRGQTYKFKVRCKGHPISFTTNRKFNTADYKVVEVSPGVYDVVTPGNGEIQAIQKRTSANADRVAGTYEVIEYATSGNGIKAKFEVTVTSTGDANVVVLEGGEKFAVGEIITIFDQDLGAGGAPNIRVEVSNVYNTASNVSNRYVKGIKAYDLNGNVVPPINIEEGTIEFTVPFEAPENLYYVSSTSINTSGYIKVFDVAENTEIDINTIIGKRYYKSANNVEFTNGLKVKFIGNVTPSIYDNTEWYVEGVGDSIRLVDEKSLIIPSSYSDDFAVPFDANPFDRLPYGNASSYAGTKDYIVINRASLDRNYWTRYNRWFHKDVIEVSAKYNGQEALIDQSYRAIRPIIEFEPGLKLFNFGTYAKQDIDVVDTITIDAFSTIEGSSGYNVDGIDLIDGMRILFTAETDILVKNKIYIVKFITIDNEKIISLVEADDAEPKENETVLVRLGLKNAGIIYSFDGSTWAASQFKETVNQSPLFEMFDENGISYSNEVYYNTSTFVGNKVFAYRIGNEADDSELGFGLSYRSIENIGDIIFEFPMVSDTFQYTINNELQIQKVENGYLKKYFNLTDFDYQNSWTKSETLSKQAVLLQYVIDSATIEFQKFDIDVFVENSNTKRVIVYVNNNLQVLHVDYTIDVDTDNKKYINFINPLLENDVLLIKLYSDAAKKDGIGYYEIAHNVERNPLNENPDEFTYGEVFDHLSSITEEVRNELNVDVPIRDLGNIDSYGKRFVKHSGPGNLALYHIVDKDANIIKALRFARNEYGKFKRMFLQTANTLGYDGPTKIFVDKILQKMNSEKSEGMPFYFSDMVPYAADTKLAYEYLPSSSKYFALSNVFNLDKLSERAVLVYRNGTQLTHKKDYVFTSEGFVEITIDLEFNDAIDIYEYSTTDGSFVPPTPTKLGLYPLFEPKKYLDNTTFIPRNVIQGHDGSLITAYDDFRDELLLDLEKRIFNNIKQAYRPEILNIYDFISGEYRNTGFTKKQIDQGMTADFIQWVDIAGGLDYTDNSFYGQEQRFTYNYSYMSSPQGNKLPGYWRGVYKQAYDTDRPHTHPWEMLGFSIKPTWWENEYGPAPYTSSNLVMWGDIENGLIREEGSAPKVDTKYARPGLLNHLPVDDQGQLLDPITSNYAQNYVLSQTNRSFTYGDHAPVETAWRQSSEFPFSLITSWVLSQPAKVIGIGFDISRIKRSIVGNLVYTESNTAIRHGDLVFPNTYSADTRVLTSGLVNYVYNLLATNVDVSYNSYVNNILNLNSQLALKVGGFTEKQKFNLILDSRTPLNEGNVFVPTENYKIILNTSSPVTTAVFSGVIIEKQPNGFVIKGYDKERATFKYYEAIKKSSDPVINVGGISESYVNWASGKQYIKGSNVRYNTEYYRCNASHVSDSSFDATKFQRLQSLPLVGGRQGVLRRTFSKRVVTSPYGTLLTTIQEVVDFLLGYEAYLKDQGFIFDYFNDQLGIVEDWIFSVKEFLFWTTQNWAAGSVITLSPGAQQIKFTKDYYVVDDIFDKFYDYTLVKADGKKLARNFTSIARDSENTFGIAVKNTADGIYSVKLPLVQREHVVLLDNKTVFNDIIYDTAAGYRQERIKVSGYRSDNWTGGLNIPGFIYDEAIVVDWEPWSDYTVGSVVKYKEFYYVAISDLTGAQTFVAADWERLDDRPTSKLIPNFDYRINQFNDFYDLDSDNFDLEQQRHAQHLIGYQKRQYLKNIINDDVSQYKFYQGMIQDKGTANVLTKLFDALGAADKESLEFYEEWALRVGQYGGVDSYDEVEFIIDENKLRLDQQPIELVNEIPLNDVDLTYKILPYQIGVKSKDYDHKPFPTSDSYYREIKDAGYVFDSDVIYRVNNKIDMLTADVNRIGPNDYIWVTGQLEEWDVIQHSVTNYIVTGIEGFAESADAIDTNANPLATITLSSVTDFKEGDIIGVRNLGSGNDGFYQIEGVRNDKLDVITGVNQTIQNIDAGEGYGYVSILRSVRAENLEVANAIVESHLENEQVLWLDDIGTSNWSVIEKKESFLSYTEYPNETIFVEPTGEETHSYAKNIAVSEENTNIAVSDHTAQNGAVTLYQRPSYNVTATRLITLEPDLAVTPMNPGQEFGKSIAISPDGKILVVGSPSATGVSTTYEGEWSQYGPSNDVNAPEVYPANSIVTYRENYWRAIRDVQPAETAVEFSTFDSYAHIETQADIEGLLTQNLQEDDLEVTLEDFGDITLLLQGSPYFPNQIVNHLLVRAPYDQYLASSVGDALQLKWNKYTNLQRSATAGNPIDVWRDNINVSNDGSVETFLDIDGVERTEALIPPQADFINGQHVITQKVDYVLYISSFNKPAILNEDVVCDTGAARVVSVYVELDKQVLYISNTNGVFPESGTITNTEGELIGEYTMPNQKQFDAVGGWWQITTTNFYKNADEFTALKGFGTPAYGLVYQDLLTAASGRTQENYFYNMLDYVYQTTNELPRLRSYITTLSHIGSEYRSGITDDANQLPFSPVAIEVDDPRWLVRVPRGEAVESPWHEQYPAGSNIRLYIDTQSPSYDFDLVGFDTETITKINSEEHEILEYWDGWVDFTHTEKQLTADIDNNGYIQDYYEPEFGTLSNGKADVNAGSLIKDQFTRAEAVVLYYEVRNSTQARAYVRVNTTNKVFGVGNTILLTLDGEDYRMGTIDAVSIYTDSPNSPGKLAVLAHPDGLSVDFPVHPDSYLTTTGREDRSVFAYVNKEYWIYQEDLNAQGRDLPASIPSTINANWTAVYNIPVTSQPDVDLGVVYQGQTPQGAYSIYQRAGSTWSHRGTFTIPDAAQLGKKVEITQDRELYRIFVGAQQKVHLVKHGRDADGSRFEFALDTNKKYRGTWDANEFYSPGEIVFYEIPGNSEETGKFYSTKTFLQGVLPTDTDKWNLLSSKVNYLSHLPNDHQLYATVIELDSSLLNDFSDGAFVYQEGNDYATGYLAVDATSGSTTITIDNTEGVFNYEGKIVINYVNTGTVPVAISDAVYQGVGDDDTVDFSRDIAVSRKGQVLAIAVNTDFETETIVNNQRGLAEGVQVEQPETGAKGLVIGEPIISNSNTAIIRMKKLNDVEFEVSSAQLLIDNFKYFTIDFDGVVFGSADDIITQQFYYYDNNGVLVDENNFDSTVIQGVIISANSTSVVVKSNVDFINVTDVDQQDEYTILVNGSTTSVKILNITPHNNINENTVSDTDNKVLIYRLQDNRYVFQEEILAPTALTDFGSTIDLSKDGTMLVVGDPGNDDRGYNTGKVFVYKTDSEGRFKLQQTINGTRNDPYELFGSQVSLTTDYLVISSFNGDVTINTRFDRYLEKLDSELGNYVLDNTSTEMPETTFDDGFTTIATKKNDSGSVTIYQNINGHFIVAEELEYIDDQSILEHSRFGETIIANENNIYVGAPSDVNFETRPGMFLDYKMKKGDYPWNVIRSSNPIVDTRKIKHTFLYNTKSNQLITYLDFVDPTQGKILGIADQEISFKSHIDLARYNATNFPSFFSETNNWEQQNVGKLWWDLSTARFKNAYQEDPISQTNNWNSLIPGYSIDIYEWVESDLIPSEWDSQADTPLGYAAGISGQSKYGDDAYSVKLVYDPVSETFNEKYYFWVKNKFTLPAVEGRTKSAGDIVKLIEDPVGQGIKFVGLLSDNRFVLYNCNSLIADKDVSLNVGFYTETGGTKNIHTEYQIVSEGLETSIPKADIELKWIDSLVGYDRKGREVPDRTLPTKQKYGTLNTPRQSWFVNKTEALKQVITRANIVLKENIIVDEFSLDRLESREDEPLATDRLYDRIVDTETDLQFIGTNKVARAEITLLVENGTIVKALIPNTGRGYVDVTYKAGVSTRRKGPSYTIISTTGEDLDLDFTINNLGQITHVNIINGGYNYTDDIICEVRPLSVLVLSDSTVDGRWSIYEFNYDDINPDWKRSRVQSYDTTIYWDYIDWYAADFNQFTRIDHAVDYSYQLYAVEDKIGDIVKINNVGTGGWLLLRKVNNTDARDYTVDYETVGRENGTIQLSSKLYDTISNSVGYDNFPWDANFYDTEPVLETRNILTALKEDLFVDNLAVHYNELFFASIRYVLSEQLNVDWVFKTSFIKAKHNVGELEQKITYQNDNLSSYNDYIEEVKPYKTNIREYLSAYENIDETQTLTTDFDVPPFYDETQGKIVPARVTVIDDEFNFLDDRFDEYPDKNWRDNVGFKIVSVNIYDSGEKYNTPPTITFVGGGGSGATAKAYIGAGKIRAIEITNPGSGYTSAPTVVVRGSKLDGGRDAILSAVLGDTVVRSMHVAVKFDRTAGDYYVEELPETQIFTGTGAVTKFNLKWPMDLKSNKITVYIDDEKLLRNDYTYRNIADTTKSYTRQLGQIEFTIAPVIDAVIRVEYHKDPAILSAQDRIKHRYYPTEGMPGVDLGQLMKGVDYGGVEVRSFDFEGPAGWDTDEWYTTTWDTYDNTYEDQLFVADGSTTVIELDTPLEDGIVYNVYRDGIRIDDPNYGEAEQTNPQAEMPSITGNGTQVLINLADYGLIANANERFIIRKVTSDGSFTPDPTSYDTQLSGGNFIGNAGGVNAEDIIVDGDLFVTSITSSGPEELVPGQVLDTVDITVYERAGAGVGKITNQNYITDGSTTYPLGSLPSSEDAVIVKIDDSVVKQSNYTIDFSNLTLTFNNAPEQDKKLNILTLDVSGQNIINVDTIITTPNVLEYETKTKWSDDLQFFTRINGKVTVGTELVIRNSVNGFVEFVLNEDFINGVRLDYEIYGNKDQQNYSRTTKDRLLADGTNSYVLSETPNYKKPVEFFTIVSLDGQIQTPGYQIVHTVTDVLQRTYSLESFEVPFSTINVNNVTVYINNRVAIIKQEYQVSVNNSNIVFSTGVLNVNDVIEIYLDRSTYSINGNVLSFDNEPVQGTVIEVWQFTNHDITGLQRTSYTIENENLTAGSAEDIKYKNLTAGKLVLQNVAHGPEYVWIAKNNKLLTPADDYKLVEPKLLQLNETLNDGDKIDIIHFAAPLSTPTIAWKQFKDILNRTHYKRFDSAEGIVLTQELAYNDLRVYVSDATGLPEPNQKLNVPGVIWIGSERIEYFNKSGNILRQLRRGTLGTGTSDVYPAGGAVYSMGSNKNIPYKDEVLTTNYTAIEGQTDFLLDFTPTYGVNEFEVFAAGTRLRKTELQSFDPTLALDSPEGDITLPAEFTVEGSTLILTNPMEEGQRLTIVRKVGKTWSKAGEMLKDSDNTIANFLRRSISDLPK